MSIKVIGADSNKFSEAILYSPVPAAATLGLIQMLEDLTHTYNRLNPASNVVAMIEQQKF